MTYAGTQNINYAKILAIQFVGKLIKLLKHAHKHVSPLNQNSAYWPVMTVTHD